MEYAPRVLRVILFYFDPVEIMSFLKDCGKHLFSTDSVRPCEAFLWSKVTPLLL